MEDCPATFDERLETSGFLIEANLENIGKPYKYSIDSSL